MTIVAMPTPEKKSYVLTVSAHKERHSVLGHQGTLFICSMAILSKKEIRNYDTFGLNFAKNDHSVEPKSPDFDSVLVLCLRGYSKDNFKGLLLLCQFFLQQ